MKSLILSCLLICATAQAETASVQTAVSGSPENPTSIRIAPSLGMTNTSIKSSGGNTDSTTGMSLGSLVDFGFGAWSFQTGLFYNRYGGQIASDGFTAKLMLDYINVPLFAKYNIFGHVDNTPYLKVGVTPGILAGNSIAIVGAPSFGPPNSLEGMRKYDIPASVGVGASLLSDGRNALVMEASYLHSLMGINNSVHNMYNAGFLFSVGVSLAL